MKRKKVYNLFQINLIVFYSFSFMLVPILIVFAYIFDLHTITSVNNVILIADIIAMFVFVIGLIIIFLNKDHQQRRLKPSYQKEFVLLIVIFALGILGIGIIFVYVTNLLFYIPHVVIPLFLASYLILFIVGEKYFNVNLLKR